MLFLFLHVNQIYRDIGKYSFLIIHFYYIVMLFAKRLHSDESIKDDILGLFADQPEIINLTIESAMQARKTNWKMVQLMQHLL